MAYTIPLGFYQHIEEKFGKELATEVAKTLESGVLLIEEQAKALAVQKKIELKDELTKELVTKAEFMGEMKAVREEIKTVREEIKTVETRLQGELKTMNLKINFLIGLMILALTAMNPVVAELLKRWLKL
ncbi:MAG: hypothetical protein EAZ92_00310 [Candidatus Kapaibacterium sp.]|nr:MAG: hypothetical protein EAZ92_00310 [Candidatus Kapabacteria bacterium]